MNRQIWAGLAVLLALPCILRGGENEAEAVRAIAKNGSVRAEISRDDKAPGRPIVALGLRNARSLDIAGLEYAFIDAEDILKHVAAFSQLRELDLSYSGLHVTEKSLKHLAPLKKLKTLNLSNTRLTDAGLKGLASLKKLEELNLFGAQVTDAGLKELATLTKLRVLNLAVGTLTDMGLNELAPLTQLQELNLAFNPVTDKGLKNLAPLTELRVLYLVGTKVTAAGVQNLQKALPKCRIRASVPGFTAPID